jgi:isopenicillin N synthase-like dioxygenase
VVNGVVGIDSAIPVIDLSELGENRGSGGQFSDQLLEAARSYGLFHIVAHGIPESVTDALMASARRFFSLPEADKLAIENIKSPQFRGYVRLGQELNNAECDWREQLDIGLDCEEPKLGPLDSAYARLDGPNQWPPALPELRDAVHAWMTAAERVASTLLRALAVALGQSERFFDAQFADRPRLMTKISRYPGKTLADAAGAGVGPHRDYGYLAVLLQDQVGGLQFITEEGRSVEIAPRPHGLVAVIGQMLEFVSRGILRAPVHYVRSPAPGTDRISVAFFYNPQLNAIVKEMPIPTVMVGSAPMRDNPANPASIDYGSHILRGYLRSHPEVARRHWNSYEQ